MWAFVVANPQTRKAPYGEPFLLLFRRGQNDTAALKDLGHGNPQAPIQLAHLSSILPGVFPALRLLLFVHHLRLVNTK